MLDWTQLSDDPVSVEVRSSLLRELNRVRNDRCFDKYELIRKFTSDRDVLDLGAIGHCLKNADSDDWLHGKIKQWARRVVGIDILEQQARELNQRGFDIRVIDATSDQDLGLRFDRIVMGDLLEHVSAPVRLLQFGMRHLSEGGLLLATTPNPWFVAALYESMRLGTALTNAEHVSYVSPTNALELGRRAGLELVEYRLIQQSVSDAPTRKLKALYRVRDSFFPEAEFFGHTFAYIYRPVRPKVAGVA